LAAGFVLLTSVGSESWADVPKEIHIGVATVGVGGRPQVGGWLPGTVHAKGAIEQEFKADGIKVEWHFFKTAGPGVNEALTNGLLDIVFQGDLPSIIGKANGLPTKIILAASRRANFQLATTEDSDAASLKDLRGRKVSIFKGTCTQLSANRLLEDAGLNEKDIKIYNMDTGTATAALASKDVEAVFGGANLFAVRDRGLAKIVYDATKVDGGKYGCSTGLLVTEKFSEQHPDVVKRFVKAVVKVAAWSHDEANRTALYQIWAKSGTPFKHWKENFDGENFRIRQSVLLDDFFINSYRISTADAKKYGFLRGDIDIDKWFDRSYLDAALAELKLEGFWTPEDVTGKPVASAAGHDQQASR
ncbi:MAG: transporter substrate-binding protein, partial [Proteobacteria bacterium]|nr:transporter substrate-binding protein [Pseudomonadota bacterium]